MSLEVETHDVREFGGLGACVRDLDPKLPPSKLSSSHECPAVRPVLLSGWEREQ